MLRHNTYAVQVTLLAHEAFRRICEVTHIDRIQSSVVAHCLLEKTAEAKTKGSKQYGIWMIRDDWEKMPFGANTDDFLAAILHPSLTKSVVRIDGNAGNAGNEGTRRGWTSDMAFNRPCCA